MNQSTRRVTRSRAPSKAARSSDAASLNTERLTNWHLQFIRAQIDVLDARFGTMEAKLDRLDMRVSALEAKIDEVPSELQSLTSYVHSLPRLLADMLDERAKRRGDQ